MDIDISVSVSTRVSLMVLDNTGRRVDILANEDKPPGSYQYKLNTERLSPGVYFISLKTHEDKVVTKIIVAH
jgi:hypothetical protein